MLKISHTFLHLCCTEGVSTERSLELFRAYNYTPRIEQQLLCGFLLAPLIFFSVAKLVEDYRGFHFSGSCKSTSEPVPCHLTAWPATKFLKRSVI
ncbi:replication protein RepA (plasmid) [Escherichia coli]